jgi:hypothetical protein
MNQEHYDILMHGVEVWNGWRRSKMTNQFYMKLFDEAERVNFQQADDVLHHFLECLPKFFGQGGYDALVS